MLKYIPSILYIPQIEGSGGGLLSLNNDLTVYMVDIIILRNLIRDKRNALDVVFRDIATDSALECVKNDIPVRTRPRDNAVVEPAWPFDDTILLGGNKAIDSVPLRISHIDAAVSYCFSPVVCPIRSRI